MNQTQGGTVEERAAALGLRPASAEKEKMELMLKHKSEDEAQRFRNTYVWVNRTGDAWYSNEYLMDKNLNEIEILEPTR